MNFFATASFRYAGCDAFGFAATLFARNQIASTVSRPLFIFAL